MIKLRLSGSIEQIDKMIKILQSNVELANITKSINNRNSNMYRTYLTVIDAEEELSCQK